MASASGTSLCIIDNRSNDGPLAIPIPRSQITWHRLHSSRWRRLLHTQSASPHSFRRRNTTGDDVITTAGGAGDGDAFRGGVCARGDEV